MGFWSGHMYRWESFMHGHRPMMHGRSGDGWERHGAMMGAGGHSWWPGEAFLVALLVVLIAVVVVGALWFVRNRPTAPHPN